MKISRKMTSRRGPKFVFAILAALLIPSLLAQNVVDSRKAATAKTQQVSPKPQSKPAAPANAVKPAATGAAKPSSNSTGQQQKPADIKPIVPSANRYEPGKVFLEYADRLYMDQAVSKDYQVLAGNVRFRKGGMLMYCDSAYFYEQSNSLDAFGNIRMVQGDTLSASAHLLFYDGNMELARLRRNVVLRNRDVTLRTDSLNYDLQANLGYFDHRGTIDDKQNTLTSVYGQYSPSTKEAEFRDHVVLTNNKDGYKMYTNTLQYNTDTHIAHIVDETTIVGDSATIYTTRGDYNTDHDSGWLYNRSLVKTRRGNTLTGDTLFYDRNGGEGEAFGEIIMTDSAKCVTLEGDYGYYNEAADSAFVTGRCRVMEYSKADTLFAHGDTIRAYSFPDSSRVIIAYPHVRFWRVDMQGLCDSMSFTERDSMLMMYRHPIIWNEGRQVNGNLIAVHFNDSTADWARLPETGMMVEHIEAEFYDQLYGKEMFARFDGKKITTLDVNGNVQAIMLPQENDSTYNKLVNAESSFLHIDFVSNNEIERLKMWPEVTGVVYPLFMVKKGDIYLPQFKWYDAVRPKDKDDIYPTDEVDRILAEPDPSQRRTVNR
ncbi:MAG: hypothetical protein J5784_02330 [Muribaculaceae bacterium]|nr:hypothetical protein [Muribaculaceae bacterium]